jgi:hypothetical protein
MVILDVIDGNQQHLRHVLLIVLSIAYHNSIQDRHYLLCLAIVHQQKSSWQTLYENTNASSFLHLTGLNQCAFIRLLNYVFDLDEINTVVLVDVLVCYLLKGILVFFCFIRVAR